MGSADLTSILDRIRFVATGAARVKNLTGFNKSHHTVPDAVNSATQSFLAKLAAPELAQIGEDYFQRAKKLFGYKRKEISLDLAPGHATLSTRDFVFDVSCALNPSDPSEYLTVSGLEQVKAVDVLALPATDELFSAAFAALVFVLRKGAPVERVIDAIEGLDAGPSVTVDYPSDCAYCLISVADVDAQVRFTGGELALEFPRRGSPQALWKNFLAVRDAFAFTNAAALRELIR